MDSLSSGNMPNIDPNPPTPPIPPVPPTPVPPDPTPVPVSFPSYKGTLKGTIKASLGAVYPINGTITLDPVTSALTVSNLTTHFDSVSWVEVEGYTKNFVDSIYRNDLRGTLIAFYYLVESFIPISSLPPLESKIFSMKAESVNWLGLFADAMVLISAISSKNMPAIIAAVMKLAQDLGINLNPPIPVPTP
jgi:hypothetical protein